MRRDGMRRDTTGIRIRIHCRIGSLVANKQTNKQTKNSGIVMLLALETPDSNRNKTQNAVILEFQTIITLHLLLRIQVQLVQLLLDLVWAVLGVFVLVLLREPNLCVFVVEPTVIGKKDPRDFLL